MQQVDYLTNLNPQSHVDSRQAMQRKPLSKTIQAVAGALLAAMLVTGANASQRSDEPGIYNTINGEIGDRLFGEGGARPSCTSCSGIGSGSGTGTGSPGASTNGEGGA